MTCQRNKKKNCDIDVETMLDVSQYVSLVKVTDNEQPWELGGTGNIYISLN